MVVDINMDDMVKYRWHIEAGKIYLLLFTHH